MTSVEVDSSKGRTFGFQDLGDSNVGSVAGSFISVYRKMQAADCWIDRDKQTLHAFNQNMGHETMKDKPRAGNLYPRVLTSKYFQS